LLDVSGVDILAQGYRQLATHRPIEDVQPARMIRQLADACKQLD